MSRHDTGLVVRYRNVRSAPPSFAAISEFIIDLDSDGAPFYPKGHQIHYDYRNLIILPNGLLYVEGWWKHIDFREAV